MADEIWRSSGKEEGEVRPGDEGGRRRRRRRWTEEE